MRIGKLIVAAMATASYLASCGGDGPGPDGPATNSSPQMAKRANAPFANGDLPALQWPVRDKDSSDLTIPPRISQDYQCVGSGIVQKGEYDDSCFRRKNGTLAGYHTGLDIGPIVTDTPIYSAGDGTIVSLCEDTKKAESKKYFCDGFGNSIVIDHGKGVFTRYAHLASIESTWCRIDSKEKNPENCRTDPKQGELLGVMGGTGADGGYPVHLHFEVFRDSNVSNGYFGEPAIAGYSKDDPPALHGYLDPWTVIASTRINPQVISIKSATANILRGPGSTPDGRTYSAYAKANQGQEFVAMARAGDYYRVHTACQPYDFKTDKPSKDFEIYPSCAGWIAVGDVEKGSQGFITVKPSDTIDVRATPDTSATSSILYKIVSGQQFAYDKEQTPAPTEAACLASAGAKWLRIQLQLFADTDATAGWVCSDGVSVTPPSPPPSPGTLNDTGISSSQCYRDGSDVLVDCNSVEALTLYPKQDGMIGRDVVVADTTDGAGGFSFSLVPNTAGGFFDRTECVRDNVTGLIWEGKTNDGGSRDGARLFSNWGDGRLGDASVYLNDVNSARLCGYSDWRLPTRHELQGIVHYGVSLPGPAVDLHWFPNSASSNYLSSSPYAALPGSAWSVQLMDGGVYTNSRSEAQRIRLVVGPVGPSAQRFAFSADGAEARDSATGLTWRRCSEGQIYMDGNCSGPAITFTHEEALAYAKTRAGWRLPNVKELSSIADARQVSPAIDSEAFPGTPSARFWSSTPDGGSSGNAWMVDFSSGAVSALPGYNGGRERLLTNHVRLVRD